jgi:hypothetical protein
VEGHLLGEDICPSSNLRQENQMEKTLEIHLQELRERFACALEREAIFAVKSNEYNFNDTAVRAKTLYLAAEIVRDTQ